MVFSARQWCILLAFALSYIFCACVFSIQAPFYPAEAEKKGATPTEYGLVFGIYNLGLFLLSPIFGKYMGKMGPKLVFTLGTLVVAISAFLFGFLENVEGHTLFITLSFILRILESIGSAGFVTASFTIIACEFPNSVATTFASLETVWGIGLIIGPTLGGALFQLGGFVAPFVTIGISLFVTSFLTCLLLPKTRDCKILDEHGNELEGFGILKILYLPAVALSAASIWMGTSNQGFLSATLEPLIRQFEFTPLQTGLVFIINGISYGISAPLWGLVCDKLHHPQYVVIWGAILNFLSFLIIGPISFMPFETTFWVTCVGLVILGIGLGAVQVSGFILALRNCIENGFPDNVQTYAVVSAMWSSMLALGMFVGPSLGGFLLDHFGFRLASWYPLSISALLICWSIGYVCINPEKDDEENMDLIDSDEVDIPDVKIRSIYGSMED